MLAFAQAQICATCWIAVSPASVHTPRVHLMLQQQVAASEVLCNTLDNVPVLYIVGLYDCHLMRH